MPKPIQARNWAFTDYENLDMKEVYNTQIDIIRYICAGVEICPKTGKEHIQGWIQFTTKRRMNGVKRILGSKKIHVEACYGTPTQNDTYCQKDKKYLTFGSYIKQGQRTDLEGLVKLIEEGKPMLEVARSNPSTYLQYHSGLAKYKGMVDKEHSATFRKVEVIYLWGKTGTGKTRRAMEEATYKIEGSALKWWDGYEGEKCILIDEYDNDVNITKMLNILDGYQLRLDIKGAFAYARWNKVYITSNIPFEELHPNAKPAHRAALRRRITQVIELVDVNDPVLRCPPSNTVILGAPKGEQIYTGFVTHDFCI